MLPLMFEPYFRPQIWGERRLARRLGKPLPADGLYGESWEISAHPHHVSRVVEGPLRGRLLTELWHERAGNLYGENPPREFPLLIKFLDCHEQLSVQVHPSDECARELLGEERGKTEAWVVLDAEPAARISAGLKPGTSRADLERHLDRGTVDQCLHSFVPRPGDCLFLPAGTVHAVGGGVLIAEVQQSSDATFRLFDWNRVGPDGRPRQLHREQSLHAIDWTAGPLSPIPGLPLTSTPPGIRGERLVECPYFTMQRYTLGASFPNPHQGRMSIGMMLEGAARLTCGDYERIVQRGETVLIPATAQSPVWTPAGEKGPPTLLDVSVP